MNQKLIVTEQVKDMLVRIGKWDDELYETYVYISPERERFWRTHRVMDTTKYKGQRTWWRFRCWVARPSCYKVFPYYDTTLFWLRCKNCNHNPHNHRFKFFTGPDEWYNIFRRRK